MSQCNPTFDALARSLGDFTCQDAPAFIHLRNPFTLSNWTLPILEVMMVAGAALALWWAVRRLRRDGDSTNLVLWIATVVYLLVIEIPLYFPNLFGVEDSLGVVFAHNAFTVQFLFERLPLYIVALYPAVTMLAYEIVRSLGIFRDRGIVLGAVCVGFVHHCLYEVFDQLGPQLRWWAWNTDNPLNHPLLSSVPMTSVYIFATLGPAVSTLFVLLLVGRQTQLTAPGVLWRALIAGALVPIGVAVLSIPSSLFGGENPNTTAQAVVFSAELAIFAIVAAPILVRQWQKSRAGGIQPSAFVRIFGPVYLGVLGGLWVVALPAYFGAVDGVTRDDTPIGDLPYAAACFAVATLCVMAAGLHVSARGSSRDELERQAFMTPDDVVERPRRLRRQFDPVDAVEQGAQHRRRLQPGQALAGARMRALAESEMAVGVAADVEGVRVVPFAFVAVGGCVDDQHAVRLPGCRTPAISVSQRACRANARSGDSKRMTSLTALGMSDGSLLEKLPLLGVCREQIQRAGDGADGGVQRRCDVVDHQRRAARRGTACPRPRREAARGPCCPR